MGQCGHGLEGISLDFFLDYNSVLDIHNFVSFCLAQIAFGKCHVWTC